MPTFNDPKKLQAHLKKALDALQAETLIKTQQELGSKKVSPKDTGRFLSSWFAAENSASSEVAPEGTDAPNTDAVNLKVDSKKNYHLTNSLPYAQSVAIEGRVVSKDPTWFKSFRDQRIPKIQAEAAKTIKQEFEL